MSLEADGEKVLKSSFLEATKLARKERAMEKYKQEIIVKIQAFIRGCLCRIKLSREFRKDIDIYLKVSIESTNNDYNPTEFGTALSTYKHMQKMLLVFSIDKDIKRFQHFCKYIVASSSIQSTLKLMYIPLAMPKTHFMLWIQQIKLILSKCCSIIQILKPEIASELSAIIICINTIFTFTGTSTWKIFKKEENVKLKENMDKICSGILIYLYNKGMYQSLNICLSKAFSRKKPYFNNTILLICLKIALRHIQLSPNDKNIFIQFLINILQIPAIIWHIKENDQIINLFEKFNITKEIINILINEQYSKIVYDSMDENFKLCMLGNIIDLTFSVPLFLENNAENISKIVIDILLQCQKFVCNTTSTNTRCWHQILGWFSQKIDNSIQDAMTLVALQLQQLWKTSIINKFFITLFNTPSSEIGEVLSTSGKPVKEPKNLFKKILEKANHKNAYDPFEVLKLNTPLFKSCKQICHMYSVSIATLAQMKMDILSSLTSISELINKLWRVVLSPGLIASTKAYCELANKYNFNSDVFSILSLACDISSHLIVILDDTELYEQQNPFTLDLLSSVSAFLNLLVFQLIWNKHIKVKDADENTFFQSIHFLLMIIYERNCRRPFVDDNHWLINDLKFSQLEKSSLLYSNEVKFLLQKCPHILPHKERVLMFRKLVQTDKQTLNRNNLNSSITVITIHRSRLIEDGYRQLARQSSTCLKNVIRVKFINEQGLDEAGIDQDGVFKEFLEETISKIFNPHLNLFQVTDEQKLYPSPTSFIQDNHLDLFNFVGKMLAKAVYEGIVVEVPFAEFFLSQLLGRRHNKVYSPIDELPSLDAELYKNLTFIKHYEGNVADLELTFCSSHNVLGKLENHDLVPGGSALTVTNENKFRYIHLMANFHMRTQILRQTNAFIQGFQSIINPEWLLFFSTRELQKLISGDTSDIDLNDLRQNTKYYGGFHNNHKVICWLWDILNNDFTKAERSLFVKFVTSCSKAPLLGFANLEPPFSIRCVEVGDDQDTGDTVGSVIKGFFNVRKKETMGRLPTSSTCFNLLKLPNYQKKNTLREKLRYSITSNTGFELS